MWSKAWWLVELVLALWAYAGAIICIGGSPLREVTSFVTASVLVYCWFRISRLKTNVEIAEAMAEKLFDLGKLGVSQALQLAEEKQTEAEHYRRLYMQKVNGRET